MLNGSNGSPHRGSNSELHEWQSIAFETVFNKDKTKKNINFIDSYIKLCKKYYNYVPLLSLR